MKYPGKDLVDLPEPTAQTAFRAGWIAAMNHINHEWGPEPPDNAIQAWDEWLTNRRNPHTQKWDEEMR